MGLWIKNEDGSIEKAAGGGGSGSGGGTDALNRQVADGRYDPTHGVAGPVVWDTINRADDASGLGAADSGQAWSNLIGVVGVDGLRADWVSSPGAVALATTDAGMTNYRVEADVNAPNTFSTSGVGVAFGVVDADNYLSVVTRGQDNGHLRINKTVAGVTTQLAEILTLSPPIVIGDWYRIVADKRGDLIVATLLSANGDALHTVSATLSGADETTFGSSSIVGIWLRSAGQLRNFAAYPSSGTPITTLYGAQDASGASSVKLPAPTGAGQALRWGSDAEVAALTATSTATFRNSSAAVVLESTQPTLYFYETDGVANKRKMRLLMAGGNTAFIRTNDAGSQIDVPMSISMVNGAVTFAGASSVTVPAPTAANQAALTTAIDATTGRMAINGIELGDTGWRSVTQENGWAFTEFKIRRIGNQVFCEGVWPIHADDNKTSDTVFTLPWEWQPDQLIDHPVRQPGTSPDIFLRSNVGNIQAFNTATGTAIYFSVSWLTENAWPSSLPGTAVASATARPGPNPNLRAEG